MSKHHHHQKDQHAPHPATILNGADGAKTDDKNLEDSVSETREATGEKQLSDFSSDRSGSETPEKSAKTPPWQEERQAEDRSEDRSEGRRCGRQAPDQRREEHGLEEHGLEEHGLEERGLQER